MAAAPPIVRTSWLGCAPTAQDVQAAIGGPGRSSCSGLPAIDLTANNALISAIINDIDGQSIRQQVMAHGQAGMHGISTGNAENVRRALVTARAHGLTTIALTGSGGKLKELCDIWLGGRHAHRRCIAALSAVSSCAGMLKAHYFSCSGFVFEIINAHKNKRTSCHEMPLFLARLYYSSATISMPFPSGSLILK